MKHELARVKITLDILMPVEDQNMFANMDLADINAECINGGWSMRNKTGSFTILKGEVECQKACDEHGTDFEFFFRPEEEIVQ